LDFFMEILIARCWSIWDQRNDAIFNWNFPNIQRCISKFKVLLSLCIDLSLVLKKGCNPGLILYEHVISTFHSPVNTPFTINRK
jgi:hypothetical protein